MSDLPRVVGWRDALRKALDLRAAMPFEWGVNDCAIGLVAPAVEAVTGKDLGEQFRGKYADVAGAKAALSEAGFSGLGDLAAHYFPEIGPHLAHIGDLALIEASEEESGGLDGVLGVVIGERIMVLSPKGKGTIKLSRAKRAFRVG